MTLDGDKIDIFLPWSVHDIKRESSMKIGLFSAALSLCNRRKQGKGRG